VTTFEARIRKHFIQRMLRRFITAARAAILPCLTFAPLACSEVESPLPGGTQIMTLQHQIEDFGRRARAAARVLARTKTEQKNRALLAMADEIVNA